ncbi:serine dehydratase subunit alpha family protein [Clostridium sp. D2Q-14]|uniref:L-cysteine desulfidase family protein n=1 Tax=Anaeromonas gelatinilytica TaxID=2683194 RepID=UPI00193B1A26|nr:L-serine ammonia-lyase, iron-sulfur-dependent, subunit alpha [Anaeromonas gelatinilytica]MBS4534076.1 serine dehydratase subunit alpha family protein [Anaeromonas gelatinilytica]
MKLGKIIIDILKDEVVPAMGCTEPVAVAFACGKAKEIYDGDDKNIEKIEVLVSPNIYKNGLGVGVPNTKEIGLDIAGALGLIIGNGDKGLEILENVTEKHIVAAHTLMESNRFDVSIKDTIEKVFIEVNIKSKNQDIKLIIKNKHNEINYIEKNSKILYEKEGNVKSSSTKDFSYIQKHRIRDIIREIENMDSEDLEFLLDGLVMNSKIAKRGLEEKLGIGVGYKYKEMMQKAIISNDIFNSAMVLTAAGADARMSGINMPVMSSNGSGNNGLTAILPIVAYNNKFPQKKEKLVKALAISHIINCYIKGHIGRLSALCGCGVAAGTGASVAITWLMGGNYDQIDGAIKNMIANVSGMICDGAKGSCALKVSTSASVAIQSAFLSMNDAIAPEKNGIISETSEETIKNLGLLSTDGMDKTDGVILNIMQNMA